jgi:predicted nucleotide-binding protein
MATIIQKFQIHAGKVGYAFVLLTPDDMGGSANTKHPVLKPRARQNVILELGYFMGKLGLDRVCCLSKGEVDPPSDIGGILFVKYSNNLTEIKFDIHQKLIKVIPKHLEPFLPLY